ncbi:uncharacterized protein LOC135225439 isoform X2 [Macrobrachium nipponense]|uniref:uncharacterized protein LOC135225439 isoform X2 n=1 Tax=Macrobrachium nipponense TaxID=159736 RepID=UPI0030C86599
MSRHAPRHGLSVDYANPYPLFDVPSDENRVKRALLIGGTACVCVGIVCINSYGHRLPLKITGVVCLFFGVFMLGCLVSIFCYARRKQELYREYPSGTRVQQSHSRHLRQPLSPSHPPGVLPSPPTENAPSDVRQGYFLVNGQQPTGVGPQVAGYSPNFRVQPSVYHVVIDGQQLPHHPSAHGRPTSRTSSGRPRSRTPPVGHRSRTPSGRPRSRTPSGRPRSRTPSGEHISRTSSPVNRRSTQHQSPNRSRSQVVGGDPPPYCSVVSERPWENPPSYLEVSSCLVRRASAGEAAIHLSAPDISIVSDQEYLASPTSRSSVASNPTESEYLPSPPHEY